jgi:ABC-2 type transport system ATP-binding protein
MCQLDVEQNKKISQLSKGYRQRVGLAQALLHDPDVLILDEPTTGLDPNQIVEVRDLIKQVSKDKTVIFSTHIMQEVQAICDRAIIINKGKKVADHSLEELLQENSGQILEVEFEAVVDSTVFKGLAVAHNLTVINEKSFHLEFDTKDDMRPVLMKFIAEQSLPLIGIKKRESSMEDVFNTLTKSA